VEKKREHPSVRELLKKAVDDGTYGLSVPKGLDAPFRRGVRVLVNEEILSLLKVPGFGKALWGFMDGRPAWLRSHR
jgi:hypothetical protein